MTAVTHDVVRQVQARCEAAVLRHLVAAGVGGVVLVVANTEIEAPVLVQIPTIVHERGLAAEIALILLQNEDRRPSQERGGRRPSGRDRRIDHVVDALDAVDEEPEVRARLVVVGEAMLGELLDSADDVLVAEALAAQEVVRLDVPAVVRTRLLVANAAEGGRVEARVAVTAIAHERTAD